MTAAQLPTREEVAQLMSAAKLNQYGTNGVADTVRALYEPAFLLLAEECAEAKRERDEALSKLIESECCIADGNEPCGPFDEMQRERDAECERATSAETALAEAREEIGRLRGAVEPLAEYANNYDDCRDDRLPVYVRLEELRTARAALSKAEESGS